MRGSELQLAVQEEFGALGAVLMTDLTLSSLGGRTGAERAELLLDRELQLAPPHPQPS